MPQGTPVVLKFYKLEYHVSMDSVYILQVL